MMQGWIEGLQSSIDYIEKRFPVQSPRARHVPAFFRSAAYQNIIGGWQYDGLPHC